MKLPRACVATVCASLTLTGCMSISPDSLKAPNQISCIDVPANLQAHEKLGLLHIPWLFTLASGPYLSEREDALGVYYRAPEGGVSIAPDKEEDGTIQRTYKASMDGGIWMPRDTTQPPHLYSYIGTEKDQPGKSVEGASCANAVLLPAPKPGDVNAVAFAVAGAAGGAAGGVAGRAMTSRSSMSYGQSVGAGLVGGAIGGLIVAKLIDMENGRIRNWAPLADPDFVKALREAEKTVTPVTVKATAQTEKTEKPEKTD